MTIDNIAAITLQPYFGALSDRTWTRAGRRLPFILIGMPLAGLLLLAIPAAAQHGLWLLLGVTILMNLGMSLSRSPVVALMPDLTPSQHRSAANGIINLMGGVGAGIALLWGGALFRRNHDYPFYLAAAAAALAPLLLWLFVRERRELPYTAADAQDGHGAAPSITEALRTVWRNPDRSGLALLCAIFFWFVGYAGIEALFSIYGQRALGIDPGVAARTVFFFAVSFLIFALPAGFLAQRAGRRPVILAGLAVLTAVFLALFFVRDLRTIRLLMPVGGLGWALININSYPMVLELGKSGETGAYTGLYYIFSSLAAIAGPPLLGWCMDVTGSGTLFFWAAMATAAALLCMLYVRRGEAVPARPITPGGVPAAGR